MQRAAVVPSRTHSNNLSPQENSGCPTRLRRKVPLPARAVAKRASLRSQAACLGCRVFCIPRADVRRQWQLVILNHSSVRIAASPPYFLFILRPSRGRKWITQPTNTSASHAIHSRSCTQHITVVPFMRVRFIKKPFQRNQLLISPDFFFDELQDFKNNIITITGVRAFPQQADCPIA